MQTSKPRTPRAVKGRSVGKRVRPRRRRPENARTASDNSFAHAGDKRARRKIVADAPRQAATRRDRKPAGTPVEITTPARHTFTAEELQARSERRRQRHRTRKLAALSELLFELNIELPQQKGD